MRIRLIWGVALVAGLFGPKGAALAQQCCPALPSPVGAARIPEPLPCGDCPTPNLVPGPLSPQAAPPGPCDALSLRWDHPSAFQCENFPPDEHCYFHIGAIGLVRDHLGAGGIAVLDPQNLDTGLSPPPGQPLVQRYKDIGQNMNFGVTATVGYLFNDTQAIEFTAFYIGVSNNEIESDIPGQIDAFFHNAPLGFEGDNGLWLQADRLHTTFTQRIGGGELNYRWTNKAIAEAEIILGLRYIDQRESLNIYTGDDDLVVRDVNGNPDPTRQATYLVETHNRMICPQFGLEYGVSCTDYFTFGVTGKAALGVNAIEVTTKLNRGDGFFGFQNHRDETSFGQIYDVGAFLDINLLQKARVRFGYNALWLVGVATAVDNLDFNLANPAGRHSNYGSIFYHGPTIEFQFLF
jgi:hypothetical protein